MNGIQSSGAEITIFGVMHEGQPTLNRPPHILVTTPASSYNWLTGQERGRMLELRSPNNEAIRRGTDVMKWKTCDQG